MAGITGRIRGHEDANAPTGRPCVRRLVVLDDPQTDESRPQSLSQCANRESILAGAVLGLAGPGKKISGIMPCTVIRPGDMADNILDRDKHPEWNGERTKMVYAFPTNETLWAQYAEIRAEGLRAGDGGRAATEFYRENGRRWTRARSSPGPQRFNHDELSAIQHAMNLKLQDEAAFFAEYQNEPLPEETIGDDLLSADQIAGKINGMPAAGNPHRLQSTDDVHRRAAEPVVLRDRRLGRGFHRLCRGLRQLSRSAAGVFHACGTPAGRYRTLPRTRAWKAPFMRAWKH